MNNDLTEPDVPESMERRSKFDPDQILADDDKRYHSELHSDLRQALHRKTLPNVGSDMTDMQNTIDMITDVITHQAVRLITIGHSRNEIDMTDMKNTIFEFENDYIFVFATEVNEKTTIELDDVLEENYMTVYVKTINGKTISIKCDKNRKQLLYRMKLKEDHRSRET